MKALTTYIREGEQKGKLPYEFYIYNDGPKNTKFKITKVSIRNMFRNYFNMGLHGCILPKGADTIKYKRQPDERTTNGWTEMPEVEDTILIGLYISDKRGETDDWVDWNHKMNVFLEGLKPYIKHGKVSCTLKESTYTWYDHSNKCLEIVVNDPSFNKDREDKIAEMEDEGNLKKWKANKEEMERQCDEEIRKYKEEQARKKKEYDDWYNSLPEDEKRSIARGYGGEPGSWTGD